MISKDVLGFLAGITIVGLSTMVITIFSAGWTWNGWPHQWDTIIVGIAAVLGASLAVRETRRQIRQAEDHRRDDLERENYAARAVLPVALSSLTAYAKDCLSILMEALDLGAHELRDRGFSFPSLPADVLGSIRESVRFADGEKRRELADLLKELQVQVARLNGLADRSQRLQPSILEYALDSIELFGRAEALFDYARREPDSDLKALSGVAMVAGAVRGMSDALDERIEAASERYLREMRAYRSAPPTASERRGR